jgi:hypothetical protein
LTAYYFTSLRSCLLTNSSYDRIMNTTYELNKENKNCVNGVLGKNVYNPKFDVKQVGGETGGDKVGAPTKLTEGDKEREKMGAGDFRTGADRGEFEVSGGSNWPMSKVHAGLYPESDSGRHV